MAEKGISKHAAQGGKARAKALTQEERSEIARTAVQARWEKQSKHPMPRATHQGVIEIGSAEIPCYVLENKQRIISTRGMMAALKRRWRGRKYTGTELPVFLEAKNLKPFIDNELSSVLDIISFHPPIGGRAEGIKAETFPMVCEVYLKARDAGVLTEQQVVIAKQCEILIRALARVGIIALVDEATGFQYERPRRELEEYLKKFLAESLVRWARSFPNDYFKHLCRLKGVELREDMRLPQYFGHLTNDLVYRRIAPGLVRALKERRQERGKKSNKLHWWTSEEFGHPELLLHLGTVVGLMKIHTNYDAFYKQLDAIARIYPEEQTLFDDPNEWEDKQLAT